MLTERLDAFLNLPNIDTVTGTVKLPRIGLDITIKAMTEAKWQEYRNLSRIGVDKKNRTVGGELLNLIIVENQCVDPDFCDTAFLKKAGFTLGRDFILAKLMPGEIANIANEVLKLSGFMLEDDDEAEAKNS